MAEPGEREPPTSSRIVIIGEELHRLMGLAASLHQSFHIVWTIETREPLKRLLGLKDPPPGAVFFLTGKENVADIRSLAESIPGTAILFLTRDWPPRAAIARAAASCGLMLQRDESDLVIEAALVSLLAQRSVA